MDWEEFKKDWLDWEAFKMVIVDLFGGEWTQQGMINASIFVVVLSMIVAMIVIARRSRSAPSWLQLIITPVLFLFCAGVVQPEHQVERFMLMVALVMTGQWLFVLFAKHEWPI